MDVAVLTPENTRPPVSLAGHLGDDRSVVIFYPSFLGRLEEITNTIEHLADFFYEVKFVLVYDPDSELVKRYGAETCRVILFREREVSMRLTRIPPSFRQLAKLVV